MSEDLYFHGYSQEEQRRLIRQAEYWRDKLIPVGLSYQPGEHVLELGCGVGAALGALSDQFPGIGLSGVDLEPRQIESAQRHLSSLGIDADLRVADATALPHDCGCCEHVYIMWLVEHLRDPMPVLREAHRVLRPDGTIAVTETDYTTFKITPESEDWDYVDRAQYEFFSRCGSPNAGRQLGVLLRAAGFVDVRSAPVGFHFFQGSGGLREHVEYMAEFLKPGIATMARLGFDEARLCRGIDALRRVADHPNGSVTQIIYRAFGVKVGCAVRITP